jgi:hypothetical protein
VWSIGTSLLVTVATSVIAFGILLVIGAWLVGPTRFAVRFRREAAPHVKEHRAGAYVVAGLVFLALIAWAPIHAFGTPLGIIFFAVLFALGTEFLCRQILRESSERGAAESDGQRTAAET